MSLVLPPGRAPPESSCRCATQTRAASGPLMPPFTLGLGPLPGWPGHRHGVWVRRHMRHQASLGSPYRRRPIRRLSSLRDPGACRIRATHALALHSELSGPPGEGETKRCRAAPVGRPTDAARHRKETAVTDAVNGPRLVFASFSL
jgi:hypothetical protein